MVLRYVWRLLNLSPAAGPNMSVWEHRLAVMGQHLFNLLVVTISCSGYLIVTAEASGIMVFDWLEIPALAVNFEQQEDIAGVVHDYVAWGFMGLVFIHAIAAMRHHFIKRDRTLLKMLSFSE